MHDELISFVLSAAANEPAARRIRLFRALANILGDADDAKELNQLADGLANVESHCREFAFRVGEKVGGLR